MVIIDWDSVRKHIEFALQHHGTRTQGEDYRLNQVAGHITESMIRLHDVYSAACQAEKSDTIVKIGL